MPKAPQYPESHAHYETLLPWEKRVKICPDAVLILLAQLEFSVILKRLKYLHCHKRIKCNPTTVL